MDEIRQYYHPDRTGMVEDVILDAIGGIIGIAIIIYWRKRFWFKKTIQTKTTE
ncbi:VanZ family protein [Pseudomonas sp. 2995-3]|uniref:VanZ family protein n=1 Tax=Pseudomonas sp. 2995-3 TaxID=1712680 RepID=UPI0034CD0585